MPSLTEYVGAYPDGIPAPDLTKFPAPGPDVPIDLRFALAFATEQPAGSGNFQPDWDSSLTPGLIAEVRQNTGATFVVSLAGGNVSWSDPPDVGAWVAAATSSLWDMMVSYGLSGIDVDYEDGVADSAEFVTAISQVIWNLKGRTALDLSIAPYSQTWPVYQQVVSNVGPTEMFINYQAYAEGITEMDQYLNLYAGLAQFVESVTPPELGLGGYYDLGLGIATSTQQPLGAQGQSMLDICSALHGQYGLSNASVWSAEYSAQSGYFIEENVPNIIG